MAYFVFVKFLLIHNDLLCNGKNCDLTRGEEINCNEIKLLSPSEKPKNLKLPIKTQNSDILVGNLDYAKIGSVCPPPPICFAVER